MLTTITNKLHAWAGTFKRNQKGVAAVEFGLLAPLLLLMLVGTIEVSRAVSINRKFSSAAATVADLVAREQDVTADDINGMYGIASHMMTPWDSDDLAMSVIPVLKDAATGRTCVYAQRTNRPALNGGDSPNFQAVYTVPANMLNNGEFVIVVDASYTYSPLFAEHVFGGFTWTDKVYLNPRNSCVDFDNNNCAVGC